MFLDTLVRYGQLYQQEQQEARNSLFGGDSAVEIARPVPAKAEEWSTIERLNHERDLVGIYLSAHPLDEYGVILNDDLTVNEAATRNLRAQLVQTLV